MSLKYIHVARKCVWIFKVHVPIAVYSRIYIEQKTVWYIFFHAYGKSSIFLQLAKLLRVYIPALCITIYGKWIFSFSCVYLLKIQCTWCHQIFFLLTTKHCTNIHWHRRIDVSHDIAGVCIRIATIIEKEEITQDYYI